MKISHWIALSLIASIPVAVGCDAPKAGGSKSGTLAQDQDHAGHDHAGHDHGDAKGGDPKAAKKDEHAGHDHPEHGPNGGHIAHFDTSATTHFEWAHDEDKQTLTVFFEELVSGGNKIDSVEVVVTSSGQEKKFKLEPLESAKIAGSIFQVKDQELLTLVGASGKEEKGVQARLVAKIDGKEEKLLLIDHHHNH
ncbi:MAG: hypothetical protein NTV29_14770 [Planctomycetota bacterium]|nr:hypothetical protein [Planctomycetota bacterium]